jgi:hypothetical protein
MSLTKAETKIGKVVYATIVILFAVCFPIFLLKSLNISEVEINITTVFVSLLYIAAVIGFMALIFKVNSVRIKAIEIDNITEGNLKKLYVFFIFS